MSNVINFPTPIVGEELTIDNNFDIHSNRQMLIDWVLKIKTREDADAFIVALWNQSQLDCEGGGFAELIRVGY